MSSNGKQYGTPKKAILANKATNIPNAHNKSFQQTATPSFGTRSSSTTDRVVNTHPAYKRMDPLTPIRGVQPQLKKNPQMQHLFSTHDTPPWIQKSIEQQAVCATPLRVKSGDKGQSEIPIGGGKREDVKSK